MAPHRDKDGKPSRARFEAATGTKKSGRKLQPKVSPRQPRDFSEITAAVGHDEDPPIESHPAPPREDRAG